MIKAYEGKLQNLEFDKAVWEDLATPDSLMVRLDGATLNQTLDVLADWNQALKGNSLDVCAKKQAHDPLIP